MTHTHRGDARRGIAKKTAVYSVLLFMLAIAQCSFFANLRFLPAVPNILLGAVAAISLFESRTAAAVCGIGAGFLADALGGAGISLSPILFLAVALLCSEISEKLLQNFITWLAILTPGAVLGALFTVINIFAVSGELRLASVFKSILLPEFLLTLLFSLPLYFIAKLCCRLTETKSRFKI